MAVVILITSGGRVQASYRGREYVEVSFGTSEKISDVINVFDYAAGKPRSDLGLFVYFQRLYFPCAFQIRERIFACRTAAIQSSALKTKPLRN